MLKLTFRSIQLYKNCVRLSRRIQNTFYRNANFQNCFLWL